MEATRLEHFEIPVHQSQLPNGLTILTAETASKRVVAKLVVRAGSLLDGQYPGQAHYLEHIKMEGPSRDGMHPRLRSLIFKGCGCNAVIDQFITQYVIWGMAEDSPDITRALLDIVFEERIDPKYVDIERGVILQECRNQGLRMQKAMRFNRIIFPHVPELQFQITGDPKSIRAIDADILADFQDSYYTPGNAALIVAGGIKHEDVLKTAAGCDLPERKTRSIRQIAPEPKLCRAAIEDEQIPDGLGMIFVGTEDRLELIHLQYAFDVLGHFPLGLLIQRLRMRDRRVYGLELVKADYPKWLVIGSDLPPVHFNYFEEAVFEEIERLVRCDYPPEIFELLQTKHRNAILTRAEARDNDSWVNQLTKGWYKNDFAYLDNQILATTREEVAQTVKKYLTRDRYGCVHFFTKRDW
jgi:predicted Zn-dependent peptidase